MAKKKQDEFIERQIIIGAIVSTKYMERLFPIYNQDYFESPEAGKIAQWCVEYFRHYKRAPGKEIALIYESKSKRIADKDERDFIEGILDSLSEEYENMADTFNAEHVLDKTVEYFKIRSYKLLSDELRAASVNYDAGMGDAALNSFNKVQATMTESVKPFTDEQLITRAFDRVEEPIFKFPGALGMDINDQLVPGGFVSFMGPEKRGKTWMLMEIVMRASRAGVPTAFFQAGDMDDEDMTVRMHIRLAKKSNREKYCGDLWIPILDCEKNQADTCTLKQRTCLCGLGMPDSNERQSKRRSVRETKQQQSSTDKMPTPEEIVGDNPEYAPCSACYADAPLKFRGAVYWKLRKRCEPLSSQEAIAQGKKFAKLWRCEPQVSSHATKTLTVPMMESILDEWERTIDFMPRIIVIDYADILACHVPRIEHRHQQNEVWAALRGLAQKRKCLVVTATQADAASYEKDTLRLSNFSEDKRKYGHVTAMWGLNQTLREREMGIMRINTLIARNDRFNASRCVSLLQCLEIGQPLIASYLVK